MFCQKDLKDMKLKSKTKRKFLPQRCVQKKSGIIWLVTKPPWDPPAPTPVGMLFFSRETKILSRYLVIVIWAICYSFQYPKKVYLFIFGEAKKPNNVQNL